MATAWAAAGLTLTATKRRPIVVRSTTKIASAATTSAIQIVFGTPMVRLRAKRASSGGAALGTLPETSRVMPKSTALTPIVVTSGGTRSSVMAAPLTAPDARPMSRARTM
jgi:hypothetical protein